MLAKKLARFGLERKHAAAIFSLKGIDVLHKLRAVVAKVIYCSPAVFHIFSCLYMLFFFFFFKLCFFFGFALVIIFVADVFIIGLVPFFAARR